MYTKTLLAVVFASLAAAAPASEKRAKKYHGISLNGKTSDELTIRSSNNCTSVDNLTVNAAPAGSPPIYEPAPIEINKLTSLHKAEASELIFDSGVAINVDINKVECRAYKDVLGLVPGSAPFTNAQPAELSTSFVEIGSVLCYITE